MYFGKTVEARIRDAELADAAKVLAMPEALDEESRFMMLEPGERGLDVARFAGWLADLRLMQDCYLVASNGDCILGFAHAERGRYLRSQHSASVVMGLLPRARGRGLGTRLLGAIDDWALRDGVSRLELTVMVHNAPAIGLYRKCGYFQEGVRRRSLIVDGVPVDELLMAKLLP